MVAPASRILGFSPAGRPRIAIASEGTLAAIAEPGRVTIVVLPDGIAIGELGISAEAETDIAWLGARLLVLSRFAGYSTAHLVDPGWPRERDNPEQGPATAAEIRLESTVRLLAAVGPHALVVGSQGPAILTAADAHLTPYQFPARAMPIAAGAAANQFVVALPNVVEEWSPASRMPKRRLRLPRPAAITALGGSERVVWMTTQQDPTRIDVLPLVNRGQPKAHDLPEPIAQVSGHPKSDLVLCLGADTGRLYAVDLDGRTRLRTLATTGIDHVEAAGLAIGGTTSAIAAQARRPLAIVALSAPADAVIAPSARAVPRPVAAQPSEPEPEPEVASADDDPPATSSLVDEPSPPPAKQRVHQLAPVATAATPIRAPEPPRVVSSPKSGSLSSRFSEWRDRLRAPSRSEEVAGAPSWRDDLVAWARGVAAGPVERTAPLPPSPPPAPPLDELAARFDLPSTVVPALALLYGAYLGGERGAAPIDVARVLGRRWDDALGRGSLAARGIAIYAEARVVLAPAIVCALDERPPMTGTLVGDAGATTLLGPCAVIDDSSGPLEPLAARCLATVGCAILAANRDADPGELALEARARGAIAMVRLVGDVPATTEPAIFVVPDEAHAPGLPLLSI